MGRPKGRKVSPAQATKKYRDKHENRLKMAAYEKLRCERRNCSVLKRRGFPVFRQPRRSWSMHFISCSPSGPTIIHTYYPHPLPNALLTRAEPPNPATNPRAPLSIVGLPEKNLVLLLLPWKIYKWEKQILIMSLHGRPPHHNDHHDHPHPVVVPLPAGVEDLVGEVLRGSSKGSSC